MASGELLTKVDKAFAELVEIGLVEAPANGWRVFGAQSAGCNPIATALHAGTNEITPVKPTGIAKSLNIGDPAAGLYALEAVRRTGGWMDYADDDEIRDGIRLLARTTGVFAETAGGVTVAVRAGAGRERSARPGCRDGRLQHRRGPQDARRDRGSGRSDVSDSPLVAGGARGQPARLIRRRVVTDGEPLLPGCAPSAGVARPPPTTQRNQWKAASWRKGFEGLDACRPCAQDAACGRFVAAAPAGRRVVTMSAMASARGSSRPTSSGRPEWAARVMQGHLVIAWRAIGAPS